MIHPVPVSEELHYRIGDINTWYDADLPGSTIGVVEPTKLQPSPRIPPSMSETPPTRWAYWKATALRLAQPMWPPAVVIPTLLLAWPMPRTSRTCVRANSATRVAQAPLAPKTISRPLQPIGWMCRKTRFTPIATSTGWRPSTAVSPCRPATAMTLAPRPDRGVGLALQEQR